MTFSINLILSLIYCCIIDKIRLYKKHNKYSIIAPYLPLILIWVFICGGQYGVGTDYFNYIKIFSGEKLDYFAHNGELIFAIFVTICNHVGIYGQGIFFIIYFISFILLFKFITYSKLDYSSVYILLYITISGLFNNQLNIVRQAFTVYIGSCAVFFIFDKKKFLALILILLSSLFHLSAITFLLFFIPIKNLKKYLLYAILLTGIILSSLLSPNILNIFIPYLPPSYAWYIIGDGIGDVNFISYLTKLIFIPLYFLAIRNYHKYNLSGIKKKLFQWGIIGFSFRLAVINIGLVNRLSLVFILISLFPIYFYLEYLILIKSRYTIPISLGLIVFYMIKVILFPLREYDYHSYFFNFLDYTIL